MFNKFNLIMGFVVLCIIRYTRIEVRVQRQTIYFEFHLKLVLVTAIFGLKSRSLVKFLLITFRLRKKPEVTKVRLAVSCGNFVKMENYHDGPLEKGLMFMNWQKELKH